MNPLETTMRFASCAALAGLILYATPSLGEEKPAPAKAPATAQAEPKQAKTSPDQPVAKVNGAILTRTDLDRAVKVLLAQSRVTEPLTAEQNKQVQEAALDQLITAELLYQAGLKLKIPDLEKRVEDNMTQGKARFPSTEAYEAALKENGLDEKSLKELTRKDVTVTNLVNQEIAPKVVISDSEAEKFYGENKDKFTRPESVKASHILIKVDSKASDEDKKKAKAKAEDLLKKVKGGEDFAALAKASSECPSSAQGGDLGYFGKGQMVPAFEKAAFAMKPGEVSEIVETQFGYHIIKLMEKKEAETTKFEDVKARIVEYLKQQKLQKAVLDYVAGLKGTYKVEKL